MTLILALIISLASADDCNPDSIEVTNPAPTTQSQTECLREAKSKCQVISAVSKQCTWKLPEILKPGKEANVRDANFCKAYEDDAKGRKIKRKSTHDGVGQDGVLSCNDPNASILTSHKQNKPLVVFECAICDTQDTKQYDSACTKSMFEADVRRCKQGVAGRKCDHQIGKTTCYDGKGNVTETITDK